jgi:hypothetical protein
VAKALRKDSDLIHPVDVVNAEGVRQIRCVCGDLECEVGFGLENYLRLVIFEPMQLYFLDPFIELCTQRI